MFEKYSLKIPYLSRRAGPGSVDQDRLACLLVECEELDGPGHCAGVDPGEQPGPLPVEAGVHRGAGVVVTVTLPAPQAVADTAVSVGLIGLVLPVPGPVPVQFVGPVVPGEAPLPQPVRQLETAVPGLRHKPTNPQPLYLAPPASTQGRVLRPVYLPTALR